MREREREKWKESSRPAVAVNAVSAIEDGSRREPRAPSSLKIKWAVFWKFSTADT